MLKSLVVSDVDVVISCVCFVDDVCIFVELVCGVIFVIVYWIGMLRKELGGDNGVFDEEWKWKNVVLVVCGGLGVILKMLEKW